MADISNVHAGDIREIFESLESLTCKHAWTFQNHANVSKPEFWRVYYIDFIDWAMEIDSVLGVCIWLRRHIVEYSQ